jgi:hypothetical protein
VVDRDPIEPGAKILLHLPHHVAGEAAQVREAITILRRDDEAKLVAVLAAAFSERLAVCRLGLGAIEPAALAVACRAVALQVADMGVSRPAAGLQAHDPRLDHDTAHALARTAIGGHPFELIGRCLTPSDPGASPLSGPLARAVAAHLRKR